MQDESVAFPIDCRSPLAGDAPAWMRIVDRIKSIAREQAPTESAATVAVAGN